MVTIIHFHIWLLLYSFIPLGITYDVSSHWPFQSVLFPGEKKSLSDAGSHSKMITIGPLTHPKKHFGKSSMSESHNGNLVGGLVVTYSFAFCCVQNIVNLCFSAKCIFPWGTAQTIFRDSFFLCILQKEFNFLKCQNRVFTCRLEQPCQCCSCVQTPLGSETC